MGKSKIKFGLIPTLIIAFFVLGIIGCVTLTILHSILWMFGVCALSIFICLIIADS